MKKSNTVEFQVQGEYALFTNPISRLGGEKFSYKIPTYEAIKGILKRIYWKPTIIWYIDEIRVMNQIKTETTGVRVPKYNNMEKSDLSYYTYLRDCCYQVRAHFEWNMNRENLRADRDAKKHLAIAKRKIKKGANLDVFLGSLECEAFVSPCRFGEGPGYYDDIERKEFGMMYQSYTYPDEAYSEETKGKLTRNYWDPVMKKGIITYPRPSECTHETIKEMPLKKFGIMP